MLSRSSSESRWKDVRWLLSTVLWLSDFVVFAVIAFCCVERLSAVAGRLDVFHFAVCDDKLCVRVFFRFNSALPLVSMASANGCMSVGRYSSSVVAE